MKTYPSVLPAATRKECQRRAALETEREVKQAIVSIEHVLACGFWFCRDCDGICDRIEGEHGQPARCSLCGSHRLEYNPPIGKLMPTEPATLNSATV